MSNGCGILGFHPEPAFALEFSFALCRLLRPARQPGLAIFLGIKPRGVFADDLSFLVAIEAPGLETMPSGQAYRWRNPSGLDEHAVSALCY